VDGGCTMDELAFNIMAESTKVMLVSALSLPCLANLKKLVETIRQLETVPEDTLFLIYNRYLSSSEISVEDAQEIIGKKAFWMIPNDYPTTLSAINQGKPLCKTAPKAQVTKNLAKLAGAMAENRMHREAPKEKPLFGLNLFRRPATA
jgi:pilus assembly protein CpaE